MMNEVELFLIKNQSEAFLFSRHLETLVQRRCALEVSISSAHQERSPEQNRLLHRILTHIAKNTWVEGRQYKAQRWKEYFKREFIGVEEYFDAQGSNQVRGLSTAILNKGEFVEFLNEIISFCADTLKLDLQDLGIVIRAGEKESREWSSLEFSDCPS